MKNQFFDFYFSSYGWLYFKRVTNQKKSRSKVVKFTEKMRNKLKPMKNHFSDFNFLNYGPFCTQNSSKNRPTLSIKRTISQKLKIRKFIFHSFQHIPYLSSEYEHFWNLKKKLCPWIYPFTKKKYISPVRWWLLLIWDHRLGVKRVFHL